jgi:2-haloacid dehalogenase
MPARHILFDAYGTLFDVHSVIAACEAAFPGKGGQLSQLWRTKQLEYTWLRTLGGRYVSFWTVTQDALDYALQSVGLAATPAQREAILDRYFHLSAYAEVSAVLDTLRERGCTLGTLSNGSPEMLHAVLNSSGIASKLTHVLSVDPVQQFKPSPTVYALGTAACGVPAHEIVFVSSNAWDIAGAAWFGYATYWVNRANAPRERLGIAPDGEGHDLTTLPGFLSAAL